MSFPRPPLCLLIPVGPGPAELARIGDLMDACLAYADMPLCAVTINDGNDPAALAALGTARGLPTTVLPNARDGRGNWWSGGLCMAMMDALLWIARHRPGSAVLRLDSDALVIGPYARLIASHFGKNPDLGMMGNFDSPSGAPVPAGHIVTTRLYWRSKRVSHDRELGKFLFSFWGWRRKIRLLIGRATRHGYVLGDWCQGGAYALSPDFLRRLGADPFFARPADFLPLDFCEDVLMALSVYALDLNIHYTTGPARLFASKWKGLLADPETLAAAGHGVIHSIKTHPGRTEAEVRAYFRGRRTADAAPAFGT